MSLISEARLAVAAGLAVLLCVVGVSSRAAHPTQKPDWEWIRIEGGEFLMGSSAEDIEAAYQEGRLRSSLLERRTFELEAPIHPAALDAFDISRREITNAQYRSFTGATGHAAPRGYSGEPVWDDDAFNGDDQPVVGVSWFDARAFARWMDADLPTEAQWEHAARGVERRKYPWGDRSPTPGHANFARRSNRTVAVGSSPRGDTPDGVQDMGGNVWEWCLDEDSETYYATAPLHSPLNLSDPESLGDRVIRGGSWDQGVVFMRSALRFRFHPQGTHNTIGFRIARPVETP